MATNSLLANPKYGEAIRTPTASFVFDTDQCENQKPLRLDDIAQRDVDECTEYYQRAEEFSWDAPVTPTLPTPSEDNMSTGIIKPPVGIPDPTTILSRDFIIGTSSWTSSPNQPDSFGRRDGSVLSTASDSIPIKPPALSLPLQSEQKPWSCGYQGCGKCFQTRKLFVAHKEEVKNHMRSLKCSVTPTELALIKHEVSLNPKLDHRRKTEMLRKMPYLSENRLKRYFYIERQNVQKRKPTSPLSNRTAICSTPQALPIQNEPITGNPYTTSPMGFSDDVTEVSRGVIESFGFVAAPPPLYTARP